MTPERFRQIEELYHVALESNPAERAALLARTDPELRQEVESLLAQRSGAEFLSVPALRNAELFDDSTVTTFSAGASLGPYRIESKLGEGGMGEVFCAVDTRLGRAVAVKITQERFSARFERESRAIASLNHPNICTLFDVGPNYLVMELVEGETIAARLKKGPLPMDTAILYASQIAAALVEAHAKGVVHRDLKPGNIMIARSGVKVLDFGLARLGQDETITASHVVMGTPAYMAPEQREGKADARSDIYSFGCVLYEMVTGARVGPARKRIPSRKLARIVSRCLEEDPGQRWQSAADLQRELAGFTATPSRFKHVLAVAAGVLVVAGAAYIYFHRVPKLTGQDTIVLADFVNNGGDPAFADTLRQGLAIQLEQSPFLKIMDDQRVQEVVRLMSLPQGTRVTHAVAHDVCVREGAAATIEGSIASLGKSYVITLEAIACQTGATLDREQIQAEDQEHAWGAVGKAATALRGKLGESLKSIEKANRPLEEATTPSMEAFQNYNAATSEMGKGRFLAAVPLFERAIELDDKFAEAYFRLGVVYENAGDMVRSAEYAKRAYSLVDRVSEPERAEIVPYYYRATGELDKEIDAWQLAIRDYPQNWVFHNQLGLIYVDGGQFEEGIKEALEAARLQPDTEAHYRRELDAYMCLGRVSDFKKLAEKLHALEIDGARIHQRYLEMAYVEDDQAAIAKETQWFEGKPTEYLSLGLQAAYKNVHGQRRESSKLYQEAAASARRQQFESVAAEFEETNARADTLAGNCRTAQRLGRPALALAQCGFKDQAEKLAAETSKRLPNGTIWNDVQLPEIKAALLLHAGQPAEQAVDLLKSASPFERSYIEASYFRGLAYLGMKKGAEAASEFQKITDHPGASWGATWVHPNWGLYYSLSYLGLARAYKQQRGDTSKATQALEEFSKLWKHADADVPVLLNAKKEFPQLR
jgi:eukaryotic-like serine/threonine-protein kinase